VLQTLLGAKGFAGVENLVLGVWMVVPSPPPREQLCNRYCSKKQQQQQVPMQGSSERMLWIPAALQQCLVSGRGAVEGRGQDPTQTRDAALSTLFAIPTKHYYSTLAWAMA